MKEKLKNKSEKGWEIKIERLTAHEAKSIIAGDFSQYGGTSGHPNEPPRCECNCQSTPPTSPGGQSGGPTIDTCTCGCCYIEP